MNGGLVANEGDIKTGLTLSYYSNIIENERSYWKSTENQMLIKESFMEYAKFKGCEITNETDKSGRIYHRIKYPNLKIENSVQGWNIVITFLDKKEEYSGKYHVANYRILLTLRPYIKPEDRAAIRLTQKIMKESSKILEILTEETFGLKIKNQSLFFSRLVLENLLDVSDAKILICSNREGELSDMLNPERRTEAIRYLTNHVQKMLTGKGYKLMFEKSLSDELAKELSSDFQELGFEPQMDRFDCSFGIPCQENEYHKVCLFSNFSKSPEGEHQNKDYFSWKVETLKKRVATQNISVMSLGYATRTMIKLEVLQKMGLEPFELDPNQETIAEDGYIYFSRVNEWLDSALADSGKFSHLLGAVVTFGKRQGESKENIFLINDPEDDSQNRGESERGKIINNSQKVSEFVSDTMGLRGLSFRIIITKRMKQEYLDLLLSNLRQRDVKISKVFYLSSLESRTFSNIERLEESNQAENLRVYYKIIDRRHLFYQPSQKLKGPFDFGTIYSELLYPLDSEIDEDDVKSLVRLAKRRLYRIYSIASLRVPEPIIIFKKRAEIISQLSLLADSLPVRLLI
ncbi:MAG: hypothetical protein QXU18_14365 [Thermoplasmatales archaeon]